MDHLQRLRAESVKVGIHTREQKLTRARIHDRRKSANMLGAAATRHATAQRHNHVRIPLYAVSQQCIMHSIKYKRLFNWALGLFSYRHISTSKKTKFLFIYLRHLIVNKRSYRVESIMKLSVLMRGLGLFLQLSYRKSTTISNNNPLTILSAKLGIKL